MLYDISNKNDLKKLFPQNSSTCKDLAKKFIFEAENEIIKIIKIKPEDRNFDNTARALDILSSYSNLTIYSHVVQLIEMTSPQKELRDTAHEVILEINNFFIEKISNNIDLYKAIKDLSQKIENNYNKKNINSEKLQEKLTDEQKYFLKETIDEYERSGLNLEEDKLKKIKKLQKKLAELDLEFHNNIDQENKVLILERQELEGLDQDFINSLEKANLEGKENIKNRENTDNKESLENKKNNANKETFIFKLDYPSYFKAMDNCKVEETRKKLYLAFSNRGYPANKEVLEKIEKNRASLAKVLGFENYSAFDLDNQMAKNPETVKEFLDKVYKMAYKKAKKEYKLLAKNLPAGIQLVKTNSNTNILPDINNISPETANISKEKIDLKIYKFKPWDTRYIKNCYKKEFLNLDEEEIAQYFPTYKTIKELFSIYEKFLGLKFEFADTRNLWPSGPDSLWPSSCNIELIEIYDNTEPNSKDLSKQNVNTNNLNAQDLNSQNLSQKEPRKPIGFLFLDLFPRENKYSHACQMTLVPAIKNGGPCIAEIIANFPKETQNKPSLMTRNDVETFFHELGHALHAILGKTEIASFSGTEVKIDFVEMPSQMFEEWLFDAEILKKISYHYKTGKCLPDKLIKKIIKTKNFESGQFLERQCFLAMFSLKLFKKKQGMQDPKVLSKKLISKMLKFIEFPEDEHSYASFGHISSSEYGAKYYCYLWSKVFALDMFNEIKKYGLLDPIIGKKYRDSILAKGASVDPNILLKDFLGREPNEIALFKDMGLLK